MAEHDGLAEFNRADASRLDREFDQKFDILSPAFRARLLNARPYASIAALVARAQQDADELPERDLLAMQVNVTRVGLRLRGDDHHERWSLQESDGIDRENEQVQMQFTLANEAYEERFNRVFLISAEGMTGTEILNEIKRRTSLDDATELAALRSEFRKLLEVRLPKLVDSMAAHA
jgi:2-oxo-4-hydroxy-4-carboxy-5-ureidoimidazoline decarboxylase